MEKLIIRKGVFLNGDYNCRFDTETGIIKCWETGKDEIVFDVRQEMDLSEETPIIKNDISDSGYFCCIDSKKQILKCWKPRGKAMLFSILPTIEQSESEREEIIRNAIGKMSEWLVIHHPEKM